MLAALAAAFAQAPESLFQSKCASCHRSGNSVGAPPPENLRQMSWKAILAALETGKMTPIGAALSPAERESIAKYLGTSGTQALGASSHCPDSTPGKRRPAAAPGWNGWADPANTRFQNAKAAGLTRDNVPKLKLKWAFGFPGVTTAFGSPAIFDGKLFVGAADGSVYSLDAKSGCVHWVYTAAAGVRTSPSISDDGRLVYFGDLRGNVYALDAAAGSLIWKARADEHPMAVITGSPKLYAGRLYVPVSGRDESLAATNPAFECCTFRGSVAALDAATGQRVWRTYLVRDTPKPTGQNAKGAKTWGPSGVAVWSSPTLDIEKKIVYVGTGVNYSNPATNTSDAVVALDMESGRILWSKQFTEGDGWTFACTAADKTNCPRLPFLDSDFGNSGVLRDLPTGKRVLVIGDKSGMVYGIDPDRQGEIVWKRKIAAGGVNGGVMWGPASDPAGFVYLGISDFTASNPETGGGLAALKFATGEKMWISAAPKPACIGTAGCSAAQPAPVTVIPGVAFLGSWDGHLRAYETGRGEVIWDFDTARDFPAVNGVQAHGGSIVSMAPVIAGGMVYITSGYSGNGMPGNLLLAFSVGGK